MFERFTDRARHVMKLANTEAVRFNHDYIGTEHILLGLVKEGCGVGATALKDLNIDLRKIRIEVEKLMRVGPDAIATTGKLPQTPRAKRVIDLAIEEARENNHNYVGTEHLLLGLLREQDGVAAQVLMNLGIKLEDVREEVLGLLVGDLVERMPEGKAPETVPVDPSRREDQLGRVRKIVAIHPVRIPALIGSRCSPLLQACLIAVAEASEGGPLVTGKKVHELLGLALGDSELAKLDQ